MPKRASQQVSLFPFLAVLVCTMGALILLLLVTTRQIRSGQEKRLAEATAAADPSTPANDPNAAGGKERVDDRDAAKVAEALPMRKESARSPVRPMPDLDRLRRQLSEAETRLSELRRTKEQRLEATSQAESQRIASATQIARLKAEQKLLQEQQQEVEQQLTEVQDQRQEYDRAKQNLETALQETSRLVSELKEQVEDAEWRASQSESFRKLRIEMHSADGMAEEPVLVECSARELRLVAENIALTDRELSGFPTADNSLIAAVRTIVRDRGQDLEDAYVLLLVRPGGSLPFYAAQKLLRGSGIRFGYELIDDDQALQVDPAAESTVAACEQAIEQAIERRDLLYSKMGAALDARGNRVLLTESGAVFLDPRASSQMPNVVGNDSPGRSAFGTDRSGSGGPSRSRAVAPPLAASSALKDSRRMAGEAVGGFLRELGSARSRQRNAPESGRSEQPAQPWGQPQEPTTADDSMRILPRDNMHRTFQSPRSGRGSAPQDQFGAMVEGSQQTAPFNTQNGPSSAGDAPMSQPLIAGQPGRDGVRNSERPSKTPAGSDRADSRGPATSSAAELAAADAGASPGSPSFSGEATTRPQDDIFSDGAGVAGPSGSVDTSSGGGQSSASSALTADSGVPQGDMPDFGDRLDALDQAAIERFLRLARARQKMQARREAGEMQPVVVFVDANWLTVEEQDSVRIVDLDDAALHTEFMQRVVDEVTRNPQADSLPPLPMVRFVVSPGATVTHHRLERLLNHVALPHESAISMQPYAIDAPQSRVASSSFGSVEGLE